MELLIVTIFLVLGAIVVGALLGFVAMARTSRLSNEVGELQRAVEGQQVNLNTRLQANAGRIARLDDRLGEVEGFIERARTTSPAVPTPQSEIEAAAATAACLDEGDESARSTPVPEPAPTVPAIDRVEAIVEEPPDETVAAAAEVIEEPPVEEVFEPAVASPEPAVASPEPAPAAPALARTGCGAVGQSSTSPVEQGRAREVLVDGWHVFEQKVGSRWITWAGVLALFVGAVFFIKHAVEQGWLGPWGRVSLGLVLGASLIGGGLRSISRSMRPLGQGLIGGGLAILYVSIYGASGYFGLVPSAAAFAVMVAVTALGMGLAVKLRALPVALLSISGGFLTPVMLWPATDPGHALFAYLLCLDLGVLAVSLVRRWRALDLLALVGTWGLMLGWSVWFRQPGEVALPLAWLSVYYLIFLGIPFAQHLHRSTPIARERLVMALTNGWAVFGYAATLLDGQPNLLGAFAMGLAASSLAVGRLSSWRVPSDRPARSVLLGSAFAFYTLAVPMILDLHAVTIAWAVEGVVLVWLGVRYRSLTDRLFGLGAMALALVRCMTLEWPGGTEVFWTADLGSALAVAAALGALAVIYRRSIDQVRTEEGPLGALATLIGAGLALAAISASLMSWLPAAGHGGMQLWATALVWFAGAAALMAGGTIGRSRSARAAAFVALALAAVLIIADYAQGWTGAGLLLLNGRYLVGLALVASLFGAAFAYARSTGGSIEPREAARALSSLAATAVMLLTTVELWQGLNASGMVELAWAALVAVWSLGGLGCLVATVGDDETPLRLIGLASVAVAAVITMLSYGEASASGLVVLNLRFAAGLSVVAAALVHGVVLHRFGRDRDGDEAVDALALASAVVGAGLFGAMVLSSAELWVWLEGTAADRWLGAAVAMVWICGSVAILVVAAALRANGLRLSAYPALVMAAVVAAGGYYEPLSQGAWLYLNGRFLVSALVVAVLFVAGALARRWEADDNDHEARRHEGAVAYVLAATLAVILVSVDTFLYCLDAVADPERSRWVAQMALSIIWSVSAATVVSAGFLRRRRPLRLAGLALFGLTAVKLLIVDTAQIEGGYRIASFMIVGALMIGASYLYNRVSRWVEAHE